MNNKKGISLIVLVITILVMIILAGVVIVSLQNDNPINKAKFAKMVDSVQSVRAAISQYTVTAQTKDDSLTEMKAILVGAGEATSTTDAEYVLKMDGDIKTRLGVDPASLGDYGEFKVNIKTGVSKFVLNEAGKKVAEGNTLPDGIEAGV